MQVFLDVADGRFLEQVPVLFFALQQPFLELQPFKLGRRTGGEDAEGEQFAWLGGHRPLVEDRQVAEVPSLGVAERHAQVALDAPVNQRPVVGELLAHTGWVVAQVAAYHFLAGGADHVPLDVVGDPVQEPERQGTDPCPAGELGHEGVARSDSRRQMADEGLKELLSGIAHGPLDEGAQSGQLFR